MASPSAMADGTITITITIATLPLISASGQGP
jgi:hypothetical protein